MTENFNVKLLNGLTQDSRAVKKNYLYAAFPGSKTDGREYIGVAIRHGASVILAPTGTILPENEDTDGVLLITDDNPRQRFSKLAAEYFGAQPNHIAAVTGTSGKTSTVFFLGQLWDAVGYQAATIGTLGVGRKGKIRSGSLTTPDSMSLHAELADLKAAGVTHLAMEASSHGLHQYRLDGVSIKAAAFTNLSRDHLDYHADMDEYFDVKKRLFSEVMESGGTAVLNADSTYFYQLKEIAKEAGHAVISFGKRGDDITLKNVSVEPNGQTVTLDVFGKSYDVKLPLVGAFQAWNVMAALGLALAFDKDNQDAYIDALSTLHGAPGRLEQVNGHPKGAAVYIDYAHKPSALEHVLEALRHHTKNRLICVFGCGGDRDKGKRPIMGKIASDLADVVIVTNDNPRSEVPALIRADIIATVPDAHEIADRHEAIYHALAMAEEGDVVVIAGKGHEQGQIFDDRREPFDDFAEAEKVILSLKHKK